MYILTKCAVLFYKKYSFFAIVTNIENSTLLKSLWKRLKNQVETHFSIKIWLKTLWKKLKIIHFVELAVYTW